MSQHEDEIVKINLDFYEAFNASDIDKMKSLWSQAHPVSIIHPGCNLIFTYDEVIKSWAHIFSSENMPSIKADIIMVNFVDRMAFVVCTEDLEETVLMATNIFVYEEPNWKMIHHQAGPLNQQISASHDEVLH